MQHFARQLRSAPIVCWGVLQRRDSSSELVAQRARGKLRVTAISHIEPGVNRPAKVECVGFARELTLVQNAVLCFAFALHDRLEGRVVDEERTAFEEWWKVRIHQKCG